MATTVKTKALYNEKDIIFLNCSKYEFTKQGILDLIDIIDDNINVRDMPSLYAYLKENNQLELLLNGGLKYSYFINTYFRDLIKRDSENLNEIRRYLTKIADSLEINNNYQLSKKMIDLFGKYLVIDKEE